MFKAPAMETFLVKIIVLPKSFIPPHHQSGRSGGRKMDKESGVVECVGGIAFASYPCTQPGIPECRHTLALELTRLENSLLRELTIKSLSGSYDNC